MAAIWWIKLTTEMFDDEKIRIIESMPEADALIVIWIRLICMAGKVNAGGHIYIAPDVPFSIEELSSVVNRPLNVVKLAMGTFQRLKMVEIADNGDIFLPNFQKYQNVEAMERAKEKTRIRVSEFRERQRLQLIEANLDCNVTETLRNDIDKNSNRVEEDKKNKNINMPEWINKETWDSFLEMRKKQKAVPTLHAIDLLFRELTKLKDNGNDPNEVLNQSIMNNWKGVFPLKNNGGSSNGTNKERLGKVRSEASQYTDPESLRY